MTDRFSFFLGMREPKCSEVCKLQNATFFQVGKNNGKGLIVLKFSGMLDLSSEKVHFKN